MSESFATVVLLGNLASTIFMVGLIWFVQIVHYPLFERVGEAGFIHYEAEHVRRTTNVVAPIMLLEAASTLLLLIAPPLDVSLAWLWINATLLAVIWLSTWRLQVPRHEQLTYGFEATALARLVATNWIRTIAWSARAVMLLILVGHRI